MTQSEIFEVNYVQHEENIYCSKLPIFIEVHYHTNINMIMIMYDNSSQFSFNNRID